MREAVIAAGVHAQNQGGRSFAWRAGALAPQFVWAVAAGQLALGISAAVAAIAQSSPLPLAEYFHLQAPVFLFTLAAVEYCLSIVAWRLFGRGDPLRSAWLLIMMSAACRAMALLAACVLDRAAGAAWRSGPEAAKAQAEAGRELAMAVGNPFSLALLAAGLFVVIRQYKRLGLMRRLGRKHLVPMAAVAVFLGAEICELAGRLASAHAPVGASALLRWTTGPLLGVLMLEAVLLRGAVVSAGDSLVSRCWGAYAAAVFLVATGQMGLWVLGSGRLPLELSYSNSLAWLMSGLAFTMAAACQVAAIARARTPRAPAS